jgi:hypothetical protein
MEGETTTSEYKKQVFRLPKSLTPHIVFYTGILF